MRLTGKSIRFRPLKRIAVITASKGLTALAILLLAAGALACAGGSPGSLPEGEEAAGVESAAAIAGSDAAPDGIEVKARLVFPRRAELTFDRAGKVAEVLVAPGDRVAAGQELARLNTDHFPALEEEIVRLEHQIVQAREAIKLINQDYTGEPVLAAQREETVSKLEYANTQAMNFFEDIDRNHADLVTAAASERDQAQSALDAAQDVLTDTERDIDADHAQVLTAAAQGVADAELALDQASERLSDYRMDLSDNAIRARDLVNVAKVALDQAKERLADYREDLEKNTVRGQDVVTRSVRALDLARERLEDFLTEHDRRTIRARTQVGAAEDALDLAQDALTAFLRSPVRDLKADGKPVDVSKLATLQAAVDLAEANLKQAKKDLAELEEGPDPLQVKELESNVSVAELNLTQAREDLAELEEGPDPILLEELESSVKVAELNLSKAREDLDELEEGPDLLVLNQLESQVELARVTLSQAEKRLSEAREGPDELILPRLTLNVTLAQRRLDLAERNLQELIDDGPNRDSVPMMEKEILSRMAQIEQLYAGPDALQQSEIRSLQAAIDLAYERIEDIEEEMDETAVYAPFAGLVYLLNVEEDDLVSENSRVLELIDPSQVSVEGFVDATEVSFVTPGAAARVLIDSLPGGEVPGTVAAVAADPRTERGIISYAVTIRVELPPGAAAPFRLSRVQAVIYP